LGETVDLQSLRDMFKNGSTGALSAACSFVRNRTIESAIEDFACQKLAESLPISSLQEGDVHPTVAAVLGQILAQHELAAWHDRARELALTPSRESLTALAALILALSGSSPPRHGHYSSLAFQPIGDGQLTGPGGGHCSDCGALSARVASARVARTSEARSAVDRAKPQERVQVLEHHHSSNCSVLAQMSDVSMGMSSSQHGQPGVSEEGMKVPLNGDALAQRGQVGQMQRLLHQIENVKHRMKQRSLPFG
jgi:hypothetical protein